ncbi:RNA recognition motif-containing protein [Besnoitia besnoiti]|uniref:RNA recognition motif-containing protein n=1 Tax=Besnoitia besnoiti TaxID=94643 RepID=A0A2A9M1G2_BESBE|nr:RNA recognition motif-containing protein [Besnoitia besnoiti]PFH31825.1 RNA recognition motif-containing protein [Besnoitia besnoiti]
MRRERDFSPPSPRYGGARRDDFRPSADGPPLPRPRSYDERDDRGDRGGKYFGRRDRGGRGGLSPERSPSLRRRRDEWRGRDGSLDDRAGRYSPPPPADGGYYRRRFPERSDSPYARRGREGRDDFRGRRNSSSPMEPANDELRGRPRGGERHGGPGGKGRRYSVVARGVDRSATQDDLRKFFGRGFAFIEFETEWAMVKVLKQLQGAEFLGRRLMLEEAEGEPSTAEEMRRRFQQRRQARYENGDFGPGRGDYHRPYARAGTGPSYRSSRGDRRYSRSPERRGGEDELPFLVQASVQSFLCDLG